MRGFVMDARNGSVLREVHWTSGSWPFLFATSSGKYAVVTASGMAVYSQGLQNFLATGSHVADESSLDGRLAQILTPGESTPRACTINFSGFPVTRSIPGALDCRRGPRHRKWLVGRARSPTEGSPP